MSIQREQANDIDINRFRGQDKRASTQSKFSLLKFRKSKPGPEVRRVLLVKSLLPTSFPAPQPASEGDQLTLTRTLTRTNTAASSVSTASTLVSTHTTLAT